VKYEWDNFKDKEKLKEYYDFNAKMRTQAQVEELDKKYNRTRQGYSDGSGHMIGIHTYKDAEDFAKFWNDEEEHKLFVKFCRNVKNMKVTILRPSIQVPPE